MTVLVLCEVVEGKLKKASAQALAIGRTLAESAGGELVAFAAGSSAAALAEQVGSFGAKRLYAATDASLDDYIWESHVPAAQSAVEQSGARVVLAGSTADGKDLVPRLAARLGVGVASDVTALEWNGEALVARRPVYSGKAIATVEITATPAIASCRLNAFTAESSGGGAAEVVELGYQAPEQKVRVVEKKIPEAGELSVAEADIIVSGGRGLKEAVNFSYIRDLAHAIGGAVGASRATVDAGWIDHQHQVGQTGRVVAPNLYIAAGISGAIQHLAGMSSSKHIIAINKDPEAPIFKVADLGVVGDLFEILPALTEAVKQEKG